MEGGGGGLSSSLDGLEARGGRESRWRRRRRWEDELEVMRIVVEVGLGVRGRRKEESPSVACW